VRNKTAFSKETAECLHLIFWSGSQEGPLPYCKIGADNNRPVPLLVHKLNVQWGSDISALNTRKQRISVKFGMGGYTIPGPDGGDSEHLWNVGKLLPDYTSQHLRRQPSSYSRPWEPEISPNISVPSHLITTFINNDSYYETGRWSNTGNLKHFLYVHVTNYIKSQHWL
jgi:hypothetical protein